MFKEVWLIGAAGIALFGAFSSSNSYQLQNYGIGSGGTNSAASPSYRLNGGSGEVGGSAATGVADTGKSTSTQAQQANVPLAPTLSNGSGTYYNKLNVIINKGGSDASDYTYSIAVSTDGFATTYYVQATGALGSTAVYQSYSTWGGASGSFITGLNPATTYQVKVNAMQGTFTASAYGPSASAATVNPSLTFSISPSTLAMNTLTAGNVVTGVSNISIGFSTNGSTGGAVYIAGANAGLKSTSASYTIPSVSADLSSQSAGFGAQGVSATQTSGGPFAFVSPFAGTGSVVGAPTTAARQILTSTGAIVGGSATAALKGKSAATTPSSSDYSETLTFTASANF